MRRIEIWALRHFVRRCRRHGNCDGRCPWFRGRGLEPCKIGMPWNWRLDK